MAWIYLLFAGLFEIAWPVGLKMSQTPGKVLPGVALAVGGIVTSGWLLWLAQKSIPIGTAYAVWTGIGAAGTFLTGILIYGESLSMGRVMAVSLIIGGVILLKLSH
jgi:quaternary ammonium compound-resistance protein SugE